MLTTGHQKGVLRPGNWLDALCREGFYVCNLGSLTNLDLLLVAWELSRLGKNLVPSQVTDVKYVPESPFLTLTRSEVPFHNDGAYRRDPPQYLILYCQKPGSHGGETLFVRGDEAVARLDQKTRQILERTRFRITLGGSTATRRLLLKHPREGTSVLFLGDPAISANYSVSPTGKVEVHSLLETLRATLSDCRVVCYRHCWKRHDLLVFDNYKVLHARTAYQGNRFLKRVEIGPEASDSGV